MRRGDHRDERDRVQEEGVRKSDGGDQDTADRGPDYFSGVLYDVVEHDRVSQARVGHHLARERLTRRLVQCVNDASDQRQAEHDGDVDVIGDRENAQQHGRDNRRCRGGNENLAFTESVSQQTTPRREEKSRQLLNRKCDAKPGSGIGQLEHQPTLSQLLHPRASDRHRLADEVQAVVAGVQRDERGGQVALHALTASSFSIAVTDASSADWSATSSASNCRSR